ncbi:hypothetical protein L7F22_048001 [Adiantum nelumboides]|nr:hypothetical protein [Adiantum nelumboides]
MDGKRFIIAFGVLEGKATDYVQSYCGMLVPVDIDIQLQLSRWQISHRLLLFALSASYQISQSVVPTEYHDIRRVVCSVFYRVLLQSKVLLQFKVRALLSYRAKHYYSSKLERFYRVLRHRSYSLI